VNSVAPQALNVSLEKYQKFVMLLYVFEVAVEKSSACLFAQTIYRH
jgi:hypothetical protein